MNSQREAYVTAAMSRIIKFAEQSGEILSPMTQTAVHAELKTMYDAGYRTSDDSVQACLV